MENKTENTALPLYKVLDEKRAKGEWKANAAISKIWEQSVWEVSRPSEIESESVWINYTRGKDAIEEAANAQFTVLAVNNLVPLAEALESLLLCSEGANEFLQSTGTVGSALCQSILKAKAALANIS